MKKQKFELSHDIIAEKIWHRLPEQAREAERLAGAAKEEARQEKAEAEIARGVAEQAEADAEKARALAAEAEKEAEEKTREANQARLAAQQAEENSEEAIALADKKTEEARKAEERAEEANREARLAEENARLSFSDYLAIKARIAFNDTAYQTTFHLTQLALENNPGNKSAKEILNECVDYLAKMEHHNVVNYKLSPDGEYIAFVVRKGKKILLMVHHMKEGARILTLESLQYSHSYDNSYHFSKKGNYLACLVKRGNDTHYQVFALRGAQDSKEILLTSDPLQYSGPNNYDDSYRFSENEGYLACLVIKEDSTHCQVFALQGVQDLEEIFFTPEPLQSGNSFSVNYSDSYRFSGREGYFAYLIKKQDRICCRVFAFQRKHSLPDTFFSEALVSPDFNFNYGYSYHFAQDESYLNCLVTKENGIYCQVLTLQKHPQLDSSFTLGPLQGSKLYLYFYSYHLSDNVLLFLERSDRGVLKVHPLYKGNLRTLKDLSHIDSDSYDITPDDRYVVYLTEDRRLKVVDISIPQEELIAYYDRILPPLSEEEKVQYGIRE